MLQRRTLLPLLAALVLAAPVLAQDATLEWKFAKDKTFYQTMRTTTDQKMKVQGSDVVQKQDQTFFFKWVVGEVNKDKNTVTLTQKIIGLQMNIDIGGSKINYDSTAKDNPNTNNPLNKFFEALNDTTFTLTLDTKKMKVTNIGGHDAFVKKLTEANPQMKPLLEKILGKQALQDMAEPLFASLPGTKVAKGKDWTRESKLDMGPIGTYSTKYTYTYDGPDKDKNDKITVKTDLKYTPPTEANSTGLPFKIKDAKLEGKDATGTVIYDPKNGWVKSSEMNLTLTGSLTIEIGQQTTTVDLTQTQKTAVTTSEKDPTSKK